MKLGNLGCNDFGHALHKYRRCRAGEREVQAKALHHIRIAELGQQFCFPRIKRRGVATRQFIALQWRAQRVELRHTRGSQCIQTVRIFFRHQGDEIAQGGNPQRTQQDGF